MSDKTNPPKRPPENPKDRFTSQKGEFKILDQNGNQIFPKPVMVVPPVEIPPTDEKIETPKTEGS